MSTKPLPTGEEPPKGYESLISESPLNGELRVNCAFISQLAKIEIAEVEAMRRQAFSGVESLIGLAHKPDSFEREMRFLPDKEDSDKLLFRAYRNKTLVGYALVVIGWPCKGEWVIQHLVINPDFRLQGVGSAIVRKVEDYAVRSEVEATSLFAIPLEKKGANFWQNIGYTVEAGRHPIKIGSIDRELIIYRKEL
jgi:GNAT superfamily N-acetyltransferase